MAVIDNLIAYWSLEEASGTRVDAHGANDLTDNNTVLQGTGIQGNCADLEHDNSEYLSIADNTDLSLGADVAFSWAFWLKAESTVGFRMPIVHKGAFGDIDDEYVIGFDNGAGAFYFLVGNGTSSQTVTETQPTIAAWHFAVCWHDPVANTVNIAIDNDATPASASWSGGTQNTTSACHIGKAVTSATRFDGLIDEVGFWKKVLTADERTWLYNSGNGRSYADIVAEGGSRTTKNPRAWPLGVEHGMNWRMPV